jgi:hypothetical protein
LLEVTHMTYARVATDAAPAYPELRSIDSGINDFLADHIHDLRQLTATRQTQPGRFVDAEAQALFRSLRYDKTPDFLATVDSLMKRLIGKMDQRTKAGLLVCMRANEDSDLIAGVLKLQIVAEHGAVLEKLDSGDEVLSAVTDLLDKPGELQKGALVMSTLPEGLVLTGDRLTGQDAVYFPTAFGIQLYARPSESVGELLDAVEAMAPELVAPVAAALPSVPPGDPETVLSELGNRIPELDGSCQADVAQRLEHRRRPVGIIDTERRSREQIKIGEITISGPIDAMRQYARINHLHDPQRWQVVVEGTAEPKRSHR